MLILDKAQVRRTLIARQGYEPYEADFVLQDYPPIRDELADAVRQWLRNETIQEVLVDGLSIQQVMNARQCEFLVAVRYLNRLLDDSLSPEMRAALRKRLTSPVVVE